MIHSQKNEDDMAEHIKNTAGYGLAGMGIGKSLHALGTTFSPAYKKLEESPDSIKIPARRLSNNILNKMLVGGSLLGIGYGVHRAIKKHKAAKEADGMIKTQDMIKKSESPGQMLKATSQVGKHKNGIATGPAPSVKTQLGGSVIGRKFIP